MTIRRVKSGKSAAQVRLPQRPTPIYEFQIELLGAKPRIWRRLQVPDSTSLGWLHAVIQVAMGWTNSHLHHFKSGAAIYSDTDVHFAEVEDDPEILEENDFTLHQVATHERATILYEYDFGDSWEHLITVEKIFWPDAAPQRVAICTAGACACPPEDCGGIWGYHDLRQALRNRRHPEHERLKEWVGKPFEPQAFDLAKTNDWLRKLKWPRVTEAQLRKVLMARDGYRE